MRAVNKPEYRIAAAVGALTAILCLVLSVLFLAVVGEGPIGELEPFTELTVDGVDPVTAATWTWFDAMGVEPTVEFTSDGTGVTIARGVFDVMDGDADRYAETSWVVPIALLTVAGAAADGAVRRFASDDRRRIDVHVGALITLGYTPVMLAALWLATVPVAPGATGTVEIGSTTLEASTIEGVTAGPSVPYAVLAAVVYPLVFGFVGGMLLIPQE
ncbi:hypothetical protein BRD02_00855 [Halobacteriales archaeon QS_8_69_73]|nr:MAG: hypothetical protein BRD02_00855 [Halobacteriales archaeon QS_8_69_73]